MRLTVKLTFFALLACGLLLAADPPQRLEVTETQKVEFPAGGVLHLNHLSGEVTIEAWDHPEMELTTIKYSPVDYSGKDHEKASKLLQEIHVTASRHGDQVSVDISEPKRSRFLLLTFGVRVDVEYRIKVPRTARLDVEDRSGEVHIIDVAGDIKASVCQGLITLMLPADGQYAIDADSTVGDVISDFAGQHHDKSWRFSHSFVNSSAAAHKLHLRIKFGDIIIRKEQ